MKINRNGNVYTVVYLIVLVALVGTGLAFASMGLKPRQQANADADKMRQILAAAHLASLKGQTPAQLFDSLVTAAPVYNSRGEVVSPDGAFRVDMAEQAKLSPDRRELPMFRVTTPDGPKMIVPLAGNGLWGPIWGYVAIDADGSTIYGAYFAHQGETPGLGAEIEKPAFSSQFDGKRLFVGGRFEPVAVVKKGMPAPEGRDCVDGVSGGTITSKGVGEMLDNCLAPYEKALRAAATQSNNPKSTDNGRKD